MELDVIKSQLNYDGQITYGEGSVVLVLDSELHTWIMKQTKSKHKRAAFIRESLRDKMNGKGFSNSTTQPQTQSRAQREIEIKTRINEVKKKAKKQKRPLTVIEQRDAEVAMAKFEIINELSDVLAKQRAKIGE